MSHANTTSAPTHDLPCEWCERLNLGSTAMGKPVSTVLLTTQLDLVLGRIARNQASKYL